ncbi:M-like protein [Deinococcus radiotolerans]|uniref:M-like protein n=1 Tax=Deinococcus radiotolerans TaxID=1309407 RepID=A0ABQ2FGP7_9DEIO|nr:M-like protein [Deinococcus radiotolerans]GGK92762.1 M-like protein [Deinococcus radiotolerans]
MTDDKRDQIKTEDEISNVDLQFMGKPNPEAELNAAVHAENKAPSEYRREGLDKQDVAMTQSMDASDPPSTNMGDADKDS